MGSRLVAAFGWLSLVVGGLLVTGCDKGPDHQAEILQARSEIEAQFRELQNLAAEISASAQAASSTFARQAQIDEITAMIAHQQKYNFTALTGGTVKARENERNAILQDTADELAESKRLLDRGSIPLSATILKAKGGPSGAEALASQEALNRYVQDHQELRSAIRSAMKVLKSSRAFPRSQRVSFQAKFEATVDSATAALNKFNAASAAAAEKNDRADENYVRAEAWTGVSKPF